MDPLIGFTLAHAEQASLHHLERRGFQGDENEKQAIFWRRERTVLVHREPADGAGFPIEAPRGEMLLERGLKGLDELRKFCKGQAGDIQELRGTRLHIGEP